MARIPHESTTRRRFCQIGGAALPLMLIGCDRTGPAPASVQPAAAADTDHVRYRRSEHIEHYYRLARF